MLQRIPVRPARRRAAGFTLVELLVVIGIIALLIGILLPALNRARQQAQRAKCLSQIRSMLQAAEIHQANHKGYYPLAGFVTGASAEELGDTDHIKYTYQDTYEPVKITLKDGRVVSPSLADITTALGLIMTKDRRLQKETDTDVTTDPLGFSRYFLCPSDTSEPALVTTRGPSCVYSSAYGNRTAYTAQAAGFTGQSGWANLYCTDPDLSGGNVIVSSEPTSYVFNSYVLGCSSNFEKSPTYRLRGKASKVRSPAQTVFCSDGIGSNQYMLASGRYYANLGFPIGWWNNTGDVSTSSFNAVSLANALLYDGRAGSQAMFDKVRHQGYIDIGFCDGHAEAKRISAAGSDLGSAYIVGP